MSKKKKKQLTEHKLSPYSLFLLLPLFLLIIFYPLLFKYVIYSNPLVDFSFFTPSDTLSDLFCYCKKYMLYVIAILMLVCFVSYVIKNYKTTSVFLKTQPKVFLVLPVYMLLVFLSACFSEYRDIAFGGMPGQFESVFVLLCYPVIFLFSYWYLSTQAQQKTVCVFLIIQMLLVGMICMMQTAGIDPYYEIYASRGASKSVAGVYGAFSNPNYLGSYVALVLPLAIAFLILYFKDTVMRLVTLFIVIMLTVALFSSKTIGGLLACACTLVLALLLLFFRKKKVSFGKCLGVFAGCIALLALGCTMFYLRYDKPIDTEYSILRAIYTNEDNLEIHYRNETLYVYANTTDTDFQLVCTDETGAPLELNIVNSRYHFADPRFEDLIITPMIFSDLNQMIGFSFTTRYDMPLWYFTNNYNGDAYYYITSTGQFMQITADNYSDGVLFHNMELLSGRGFIWSRSIPLLKKSLLLGSGADTFVFYFPNDDYVTAFQAGFVNTLITKPHNMYLQIAIQNGIPALLLFLVLYLYYFFGSIKLYLNANLRTASSSKETLIGFCIFLGTFGYMVIGMVNDSSLTVAPFFWFLLGCGYALNKKIASR